MLFLLVSLIFAALAYNVLYPQLYSPRLSTTSFVAGWLTGELALHHLALQVVVFLVFWLADGINGSAGTAGVFLCLGSWAALLSFHGGAAQLPRKTALALDAGLGSHWRESIPVDIRGQLQTYVDPNDIALPINPISPAVEVIKNVPYGDFGQHLDIYRKRGLITEPSPVLLQVHGGGWTENMGSKNEQGLPLMSHMAERHGWICVACSYRLSPTHSFPAHIIDVKQAVAWIRSHIGEFGGDPNFVAVTGGSAGGHLAALLALTPGVAAFQPGFESADTSVQAAVPFYGVHDFAGEYHLDNHDGLGKYIETTVVQQPRRGNGALWRQASPLANVSADAPPFMLVHGTNDSVVAVAHSRALAARLTEVSANPCVYLEVDGAQHAFDMFASPRSVQVKHGVAQFLTWSYARYSTSLPMLTKDQAEEPVPHDAGNQDGTNVIQQTEP